MTPLTIAVLPGGGPPRPCRDCGQPISLKQVASTGNWMAFDADPVVLKTVDEGGSLLRGGRLVHLLDRADRHQCGARRA
ncbi:MAG TPA: hypothetical protein DCQ64_19835 [Candidatus Rokubacteria bacterium]|nr:hypothetical protein [Candidatus Rokubacteria bacterium]